MKLLFGSALTTFGLAALLLGLTRVYSNDPAVQVISTEGLVALFLIFGGEAAAIEGATIAKGERFHQISNVSNWLFATCFVMSMIMMVVGLVSVFNTQRTLASVLMLVIGFFATVSSASQAISESGQL